MTKDLFGFVDGIALHPEKGILALQITSGYNGNSRVAKIRDDFCWPKAEAWLKLGGAIEVWDWNRTKASLRWKLRICRVTSRTHSPTWEEA